MESTRFHGHPAVARIRELRAGTAASLSTGGTRVFNTGSLSSGLATYGQHCTATIRDNRDKEKREITDLNNRLARYIEKVRFLQAQNKILEGDIELFRNVASLHGSRMLIVYESESKSLRTLVAESQEKKRTLNIQTTNFRKDVELGIQKCADVNRQHQLNREASRKQMRQLSDIEAEVAYKKREIAEGEAENGRLKSVIARIRTEIAHTISKRDKEKSGLSGFSAKISDLMSRIKVSTNQHESKIREEIANLRRDSTPQNREYFHRELHAAIREIRERYEKSARTSRLEWEEWYKKKVHEIKSESERMSSEQSSAREEAIRIRMQLIEFREKLSDLEARNQQLTKKNHDLHYQEEEDLRLFEAALTEKENAVQRMRAECTSLSIQVDKLCDNQTSLQAEISYYRKLMEQAEHIRRKTQEIVFDPSIIDTSIYNSTVGGLGHYRTETQTHSIYNSADFTRTLKGDIAIAEHSIDGKSITLENRNLSRSHNLSGWKLVQYVSGVQRVSFTFPAGTRIEPNNKITVYTRDYYSPYEPLICNDVSVFDFGTDTKFSLFNEYGEEVAWYAHHLYNH